MNRCCPGDLVICRGTELGIILELDEDARDNNVIWVKIMWSTGDITWEDILASTEDSLFKVINESR